MDETPIDKSVLDYQQPSFDAATPDTNSEQPLFYKNWRKVGRFIEIKVIDNNTTLQTGDLQADFCVPAKLDGAIILSAHAWVTTVSSSGLPTVQLRNVTDSADILSTKITIDVSEFTSFTAAAPPIIDPAHKVLTKGDIISVDVDGAGTGAKGLGVMLELQ